MSQICDSCGAETERYFIRFHSGRSYTECKVCNQPRHSAPSCVNPYADLTLEHVHDESGKPLRVTSKRQLLEAEKRFGFRSLVANMNSENFDKPPQVKNPDPYDRISQQLSEQVGRRDSHGNKLGFLYPEVARAQLRELKEKGISIDDW
jgi:hypothetical protein